MIKLTFNGVNRLLRNNWRHCSHNTLYSLAESTDCRRPKRQILSFKRSKSANLASLIDKVKSDKDGEKNDRFIWVKKHCS